MKFQQIIFALNRIIQVLISLEFTLLNIIPKSLVTLQFLKFLIVQIKAYIQGFQMRYQSFLGHWYPNSYSWFSDSMDILFVLITTVLSLHQPLQLLKRTILFCHRSPPPSPHCLSFYSDTMCTIWVEYSVKFSPIKERGINSLFSCLYC